MKTDNHKENGEGCYKKMIHRRENWMAGKHEKIFNLIIVVRN